MVLYIRSYDSNFPHLSAFIVDPHLWVNEKGGNYEYSMVTRS